MLCPWGKNPQYPLYRRMGEPQRWSGHRGYRKNPPPLLGIEPQSSSLWSDTILTELSGSPAKKQNNKKGTYSSTRTAHETTKPAAVVTTSENVSTITHSTEINDELKSKFWK
jgi:hypothetical protein